MESPKLKPAPKCVKNTSHNNNVVRSPPRAVKSSPSPPLPTKSKSPSKDEQKERIGNNHKVTSTKRSAKENTKPVEIKIQTTTKENTKSMEVKLQTKERALKRAFFNYSVATKLYIMEQQKRQIEKIQRMIEEEEVKMLRKEMIPRAQLMPLFDRPFFPRRSTPPLTAPKERNSQNTRRNSFSCTGEFYNFRHNEAH